MCSEAGELVAQGRHSSCGEGEKLMVGGVPSALVHGWLGVGEGEGGVQVTPEFWSGNLATGPVVKWSHVSQNDIDARQS